LIYEYECPGGDELYRLKDLLLHPKKIIDALLWSYTKTYLYYTRYNI
jgi:hypothetical protein